MSVATIAGAEDTIDAMDLRAFGVGRRTWHRQLRFGAIDWLVVVAFVAFTITGLALGISGNSQHYQLPFLVGG